MNAPLDVVGLGLGVLFGIVVLMLIDEASQTALVRRRTYWLRVLWLRVLWLLVICSLIVLKGQRLWPF